MDKKVTMIYYESAFENYDPSRAEFKYENLDNHKDRLKALFLIIKKATDEIRKIVYEQIRN